MSFTKIIFYLEIRVAKEELFLEVFVFVPKETGEIVKCLLYILSLLDVGLVTKKSLISPKSHDIRGHSLRHTVYQNLMLVPFFVSYHSLKASQVNPELHMLINVFINSRKLSIYTYNLAFRKIYNLLI